MSQWKGFGSGSNSNGSFWYGNTTNFPGFLYKKNVGVGGRRSTKMNPGGNITCNSSTYLYNKYKPGQGGVGASSIANRRAKNRLATVCGKNSCFPCYNSLGQYSNYTHNPNGFFPCPYIPSSYTQSVDPVPTPTPTPTPTGSWNALVSGTFNGVNSFVRVIQQSNSEVYVGGSFTIADVPAGYVAKWNDTTSTWSYLGTTASFNSNGTDAAVYAIAIKQSNGNVYVGGDFSVANNGVVSTSASRIAMWNGTTWSSLGTGVDDRVYAIAINQLNGNVYAGGNFINAGGNPANYVAMWNGTTWSSVGTPSAITGQVYAIAINQTGNVYVGGAFLSAGANPAYRVAMWNGTTSTWTALGSGASNGTNGNVYAIAVNSSNGKVYVGGNFVNAGGIVVNNVAMWDGTSWSALGSGVGAAVNSLSVNSSNGKVYVGGNFVTAGGNPAYYVAMWNV